MQLLSKLNKPMKNIFAYLKTFSKEKNADVWGPIFWLALHNYAKYNKLTPQWLRDFTKTIPCQECRGHFREAIKNHPLTIAKNHLIWTWLIHNIVNTERSNKPFFPLNKFNKEYIKKETSN